MRLNRDFRDNLLIERHPTGYAAHSRQNVIVISTATSKAAAMQVEGYTRGQHKVQPV